MPAVKGCHSMAPGFLGLLRVPIDSTEGSSVLPPQCSAVQSTPPKCEIQEQGGIAGGRFGKHSLPHLGIVAGRFAKHSLPHLADEGLPV